MPRKREIRPGFAKDEDLGSCSPLARLFAALLPMWADREGYVEDRPRRLRADILPYDNIDGELIVDELLNKTDYIKRVTIDGVKLLWIVNFKKHQQNVHKNEVPSTHLGPCKHPPRQVLVPSWSSCSSWSSCNSREELLPTAPQVGGVIPYSEIMEYLNEVCGKDHKTSPVAESFKRLIRARWKQGARLDAFKAVIDVKASQWKDDDKMARCLRPSTLFRGAHWDEYLAEARQHHREEIVAQERSQGASRRSQEIEAHMEWEAEVDMLGEGARPLEHFMAAHSARADEGGEHHA